MISTTNMSWIPTDTNFKVVLIQILEYSSEITDDPTRVVLAVDFVTRTNMS